MKLWFLRVGGVNGIPSVAVKCVDIGRNTSGEGDLLDDNFPVKMFQNGAAGYGQNSLCGCLGGAAAVIGLVCESADSKACLKEVMEWYKTSTLPTYDRGSAPAVAQVVPGSPNCADSLLQFFQAAPQINYDMSHPDRINRCACLTADVARKTAEVLNAKFGV